MTEVVAEARPRSAHADELHAGVLAFLVVLVTVLARLVVVGGAGVEDLELGQDEDDGPCSAYPAGTIRDSHSLDRTGRSVTKLMT